MDFARRYLTIALCFAIALTTLAVFTPRAVHAVTAALVQVMNTAANPVPSWRTDNDGRHPVYLIQFQTMPAGTQSQTLSLLDATTNSTYTVPAGKRLVVDTVSLFAYPLTGQKATAYLYNGFTFTGIPALPQGTFSGIDYVQSAAPVRDYVEPGGQYSVTVNRSANNGFMDWDVSLVGHLVDCTNGGGC